MSVNDSKILRILSPRMLAEVGLKALLATVVWFGFAGLLVIALLVTSTYDAVTSATYGRNFIVLAPIIPAYFIVNRLTSRRRLVSELDRIYYERNMLALAMASHFYVDYDAHDEKYGDYWKVLSITLPNGGKLHFHVPPDFPTGNLPKGEPDWDGATHEEKWHHVYDLREIPEKERQIDLFYGDAK